MKNGAPELQDPIRGPARFPSHDVTNVRHYWMDAEPLTGPMSAAGRAESGSRLPR